MMLLMGMWMSLTKKPMKPMIAKPIAVATAIFWNSIKVDNNKHLLVHLSHEIALQMFYPFGPVWCTASPSE